MDFQPAEIKRPYSEATRQSISLDQLCYSYCTVSLNSHHPLRAERSSITGCREKASLKSWNERQQQSLWDSILRYSYIPPLVLREIIDEGKPRFEVLDGCQRIVAIRCFLAGYIQLPQSVQDLSVWEKHVPTAFQDRYDLITYQGGYFIDLPQAIQKYVLSLTISADIIHGIDNYHADQLFTKLHPELFF